MEKEELKQRTKQFSLRVITLIHALPRSQTGKVLGNQLLRSGTSVGANYRAACRARSVADFISKIGIVVEEADESLYWMELIVDSGIVKHQRMANLMQEANELISIFTATLKTTKRNQARTPKSRI